MPCLRSVVILWMALLLCAGALIGQSSLSVTAGPLQKKALHERFLRLLKGGDGYLYAVKGSMGHFWQFGGAGELGVEIIRLDAALRPTDTLKIKRLGPAGMPRNVLEVATTQDGIGILSFVAPTNGLLPSLQIFRPHFGEGDPRFTCEKLADLPGIRYGIDNLATRVTYSPDSATILVSWRRLPQAEGGDQSLTCILLDRDLRVIHEPFFPFKQFQQTVSLHEILMLDEDHILFTAQTIQPGSTLGGPSTTSFGILHYGVAKGELRVIRFRNNRDVPVETRLGVGPHGEILAAGWYLDQSLDRREAGVYIGRITGADSLEDMQRMPLSEPLRAALIRRESRNGALGIRTGFHSALLCGPAGFSFVLHLRGEADAELQPTAPGSKVNNTLHCWSWGNDFTFLAHSMSGFYSAGREELMEAFSWRPLWIDGRWHALATDFSGQGKEADPSGATSVLWSVPGGEFEQLAIPAGEEACALAPRDVVRIGLRAWAGICIAGNRWRIVRMGD